MSGQNVHNLRRWSIKLKPKYSNSSAILAVSFSGFVVRTSRSDAADSWRVASPLDATPRGELRSAEGVAPRKRRKYARVQVNSVARGTTRVLRCTGYSITSPRCQPRRNCSSSPSLRSPSSLSSDACTPLFIITFPSYRIIVPFAVDCSGR